jgi:hypothetical protein
MIIAGIHGGYEWNTVHLANELIELLNEEPERIPADKTLYILPQFESDGYAKDFGPDGGQMQTMWISTEIGTLTGRLTGTGAIVGVTGLLKLGTVQNPSLKHVPLKISC